VADPGRNKLIINHLGRMFVTSDAATIIREIEVVHPAAKLLVMASQAQEAEVCELRIIPHTKS
jgi:chaperonin GroEL (HSP60 family)